MAELGRTVLARQRMARLWSLGDRSSPSSYTPGLILAEGEEMDVNWAPFHTSGDNTIPREISLVSRAAFAPWVTNENGPELKASVGHVLPPSLEEADAGEVASKGELLPLSWQALNHDGDLMNGALNPHVVLLTDALQLANRPGKLVEAINVIKLRFPGALLWCPGIGGPDNCAVYSWFGVDLFDNIRVKQAESCGAVLTMNGPRIKRKDEPDVDHWALAIAETRTAINEGKLRELAQSQSLNSPRLVEHLRNHDNLMSSQRGILSQIVPEKQKLRVHSSDAHNDPIIVDWIEYITEEYTKPEGLDNVLVLLPCSARKPYSSSRTHRAFRRAMNHNSVHEIIVTSPLGLVPRELEGCWPAGNYDIPVTGDWTEDETSRIKNMLGVLLGRNDYRIIINHSGFTFETEIPVIETIKDGRSTSNESLESLSQAIKENVRVKRRSGERINLDNFKSIANMHHNNSDWLEGCTVRGRFPRWKIMKDSTQIAMWSPERGGFSLSKACIPILDANDCLKRISLKPDAEWKGDINLTNLESYDGSIRSGEDLLVMQANVVVGLARAAAPSWEWLNTPGRLAKMHHKV
ncbi:MAG: DUF5591 domain-containing protein [Candidatus Poseidoniaceae archaeon]|nr:DUF5591 domain-containing protein [Candidatus Poseidoniaceae archaeon]